MAVKLSQRLAQTQSLMMTPQLQQAIKLLTLTHLEMTNVISEEMVENPLLEESGVEANLDSKKSEEDYKVENLEMQSAEAKSENFDEPAMMKGDTPDEFDWKSYVESFESSSSMPPSMSGPASDEDSANYENIVSKGMSLAEHLEWQLRMEDYNEKQIEFGLQIIHNINDDGYLAIPFEEILSNFDYDRDEGLEILEEIKSFDPVGCACETLTDCLMAQAKIAEERSPLLERIIRDHLEDLQNKDIPKIVKATGVSAEQIMSTAELLHNFHPKPGRLVSTGEVHYIVPDIYVVKMGNEFVVNVNDDGVPRLKISNLYKQMLMNTTKDDPANEFVQEKLKSAMWLIKSIQNRQKTIYRVAKAIVRQQQDFFKKGPKFLRPMVLKDVAEEIGMHESTVSRVTTNKYMHTPIGMFELKYFFNTGIGGKNGGIDIASEVLKLKVKALVENENPKKPFSDQKIVEMLKRDDIVVARRTVAKYREMLGILSSSKRKVKI